MGRLTVFFVSIALCLRAEPNGRFSTAELEKLIRLADAMELAATGQSKAFKHQHSEHKAFELMSATDLKAFFSEPHGYISSRERRGWKVARRLAQDGLDPAADRERISQELTEVLHAIQNNHRPPAPASVNFLAVPILFLDYLHNPIGRGELPAANLQRNAAEQDLSRLDPEASTFWQRPTSIESQNLYAGFGRTELPTYETNIWEYAGPKTSWGGCPGFEARCGEREIKVKLAETRAEPFVARIFDALGFNVDPTDHAPHLKIKYSRRLFREFHLRKDLKVQIHALRIPFYTINLQRRYDPFSFVTEAVLKDGTRLPGSELRRFLLRNTDRRLAEDDQENFLPENEAQIDSLVMTAANIQSRDTPSEPIGPWTFGDLGHQHLRELRGAGLLAAWLGWYDSRFANTRLKVCVTNGQMRLVHFFSDLGSALGKSVGMPPRPIESPELFAWTFTRPEKPQGKGHMTLPFRIRDFQPIANTPAFREMTMDDARWMARLIAQLSEKQIVEALKASGFDAKQGGIYTEKLISRRDRLIQDLGLSDEIAALRPNTWR